MARIDSKYFDADIGEGERNGSAWSPGGHEFAITTQLGAFQVSPRPGTADPVVRPIVGIRVPEPDPEVTIPKKKGEPVTAGVVKITADGKHMIVGYGYFDLEPQIFTYRKGRDGSWIEDKPLPQLPTDMDIFHWEFGVGPLYVGTGDQAYRRNHARQWTQIDGVGEDAAIQGISTVGGHRPGLLERLQPSDADTVERVIHANFFCIGMKMEAGPNIRAFGVWVVPGETES